MKLILLLLFVNASLAAHAQCLSGNCTDGQGKYDFGWCVYEGDFKNGKAEGQGSMKYGDFTYSGHFSNGVEDGEGSISYNDGRTESVRYSAGRKLTGPTKIAASEYKPLEGSDANCISGDCINGMGTYQFPSGNKYTGHFKDRKREGDGTIYFANGDHFTGVSHDNIISNGTYSFSSGASYSGSYDAHGMELNGIMKAGGISVPYVNGVAHVPPPKPATAFNDNGKKSPNDKPAYRPCCPVCHCLGKTHETYSGGATEVDRYGNRSIVFGSYSKCTRCGGTGHIDQAK